MFKVGDKVIAKMPDNCTTKSFISWVTYMDRYDGTKLTVDYVGEDYIKVKECGWTFANEWVTKTSKFKGNNK